MNPVISQRTDLTLAEAVDEFLEVSELLNQKEFPDGGRGWAAWVVEKINFRLNQLREIITDRVIEKHKKKAKVKK